MRRRGEDEGRRGLERGKGRKEMWNNGEKGRGRKEESIREQLKDRYVVREDEKDIEKNAQSALWHSVSISILTEAM